MPASFFAQQFKFDRVLKENILIRTRSMLVYIAIRSQTSFGSTRTSLITEGTWFLQSLRVELGSLRCYARRTDFKKMETWSTETGSEDERSNWNLGRRAEQGRSMMYSDSPLAVSRSHEWVVTWPTVISEANNSKIISEGWCRKVLVKPKLWNQLLCSQELAEQGLQTGHFFPSFGCSGFDDRRSPS